MKRSNYPNLAFSIMFCLRLLYAFIFSIVRPPIDSVAYWQKEMRTLVIYGLIISCSIIFQSIVQWRKEKQEQNTEGKTGLEIEKQKERSDLAVKWSVGVASVGLAIWLIVSIVLSFAGK